MFVDPFAIVHTLRKLHTFEFHEDLARDSMNADLPSEFQHGLALRSPSLPSPLRFVSAFA